MADLRRSIFMVGQDPPYKTARADSAAAVMDTARVARNPSPAPPRGRGHFGSMGSAEDGDGFHDFFHAEEVAVVRLNVDGVYVGLCAFVNFVLQALDVCVRHEFDFVEL